MKKKKTSKRTVKPAQKKSSSKSVRKKAFGQHKHFQDLLLKKREEILHTVKQKEEDITMGEIGDEADAASQTFEREMMFEMTNGERIVLDEVEASIRKIEKGEFGLCESCHKKIPSDRLQAMPWVRYCIQCKTRTEAPSRS